ncbi:hypothetical protein [Mycolicibacterium phlei]|uniref:hypothetical protein n=1 Tax=Mycolicibacterium phlei TaxID=1771 RepID=UPI00031EC010|nr:hypothetical protein [Mycolicibacterium phlei]MBF4194600.1 hypothetical protein [Mycolicibacterium phlei]
MAEKYKLTLYSTNDSLRAKIRDAFKGAAYEVVEVTDGAKIARSDINEVQQAGAMGRLQLPDKVDAVVSTTGLNSAAEGLAATLGLKQGRNDVYAVVIPEAMDWLRNLLAKRGELVLVGADQAK